MPSQLYQQRAALSSEVCPYWHYNAQREIIIWLKSGPAKNTIASDKNFKRQD